MSSVSKFVNSWLVDSENVLGDRPDGEVWNFDFRVIKDFDKKACISRVLTRGGTEADGLADWASQVDACTPNQKRAYDLFRLAMMTHQEELLVARRREEDEALQLEIQLTMKAEAVEILRKKASEGETAQMRAVQAAAVEAKKKDQAGLIALLQNRSQGTNQGIKGTYNNNGNNLKSYFTVDGLEILTDVKGATSAIAKNRSLYRTFELARFTEMVDHSGIGWTLDQALQVLTEARMAIEDLILVPPADPHYALTFWSFVEGNPGFIDRVILERLIRMQFLITDGTGLHYLMFYPHGIQHIIVYESTCHIQCLEAIQMIWWMFFGRAWRYALQPIIDRIKYGDLSAIFKVNAYMAPQQDVHVLLTHQIQTAFGLVGNLVRKKEPRQMFATELLTQQRLVEDIQDVFEKVIPPGNNSIVNAGRILDFNNTGKLAMTLNLLERLQTSVEIVTPPKNAKKRPAKVSGETDDEEVE